MRALVVAADHSTFGDAAAALSITQPAFTKQMQQLESLVGTPLFRRGRHGAVLTAAGEALLGEARAVVDLADRFENRVKRMAAGDEGHLSVGFGLSSIEVAPRVVAAFRSSSPGVTVRLEDMSSSAQVHAVQKGDLDIAFARMPAPRDLRALPVLSDRLVIAHPEAWQAPPEDVSPVGWLQQHPLVRLSSRRGPGLSAQIARHLTGIGAAVDAIQEADDLQTVLALVAAGVGAAIVPESARNIAPPRVRMHPLSGASARWRIGALWRADNETPVVRSFLGELARFAER